MPHTHPLTRSSAEPIDSLSRSAILLLFIGLLSTHIGQAFIFAVLPPLGRSVGLDEIRITAIISTSALVFAFSAPTWGRLSDRIGRKPVILIGLMGYSIGSLTFALLFGLAGAGWISSATLFGFALITRSLQAATMSATNPGCIAYAADQTSTQNRTRIIARLTSANSLGMIVGPVFVGLVAGLGLLTPLVVASILSATSAMLISLRLPNHPIVRRNEHQSKKIGYFDNRLRPFLVSAIGAFTGFAMIQQTLAFRLQDSFALNGTETAQHVGLAMMASAAAMLLMQIFISQRYSKSPIDLVRWGAGIMAAGTITISLFSSWLAILSSMAVIGAGLGLLMPAVTAGASLALGAEEQGGAAGLVSACPAAGFIMGPIAGGILYQYSAPAASWGAASVLILTFLTTLRLSRTAPF